MKITLRILVIVLIIWCVVAVVQMNPVQYVSALLIQWVTLMSGVVSIILDLVSYEKRWNGVPRGVYWVVASLSLFVASGQAWNTERTALQSEQKRSEAAESRLKAESIPEFKSEMRDAHTGLNERRKPVIFVVFLFKNTGALSTIDNFKLSITLKDGAEYYVDTEHFTLTDKGVWFPGPEGALHLVSADYLPRKGSDTRVEHGASLRGWIGGEVPGLSLNEINARTSILRIYFNDITGKTWVDVHPLSGGFVEGEAATSPNKS
jgi:hypothetical protein